MASIATATRHGQVARSVQVMPNILSALRAHRLLLILFALLQLGDVISTHLALRAGLSEGNPIPATILSVAGEGGMYAAKLLAVVVFLIAVCCLEGRFKTNPWRAVGAVNLVMLAVVLSNMAQLV